MQADRYSRSNRLHEPSAGSHATLQQITAQFHALRSAALRSHRRRNRLDADFDNHVLRHALVKVTGRLSLQSIAEGPFCAAFPKVDENDDARDGRVCAPQRGERVPLVLHDSQQDSQVCRPENYHHSDARKE